jgi:tRNA pseudouridine38-40 synthase
MSGFSQLSDERNWKLILAYDGTDYFGWQVQPDLVTVQGELSDAIERVTGERVLPQGSGRTDAGVHARGQVASFMLRAPIPPENLLRALNRTLPESIRVLSAGRAEAEFHARHSVKAKTYEYRIFRGEVCPPWEARFAWALNSTPARRRAGGPGNWPLEVEAMKAAAERVVGMHDFSSFAASDPDLGTRRGEQQGEREGCVRTIFESRWDEAGDSLVYRVRGDGFLQHMVRNLVGTFVAVGRGQWKPEDVERILEARSRSAAGATAPARGLFLDSVEY